MLAEQRGKTGRWLEVLRSPPRPRGRLVMFHYAGGSASVFRPWAELLRPDVLVQAMQLPGREGRSKEPLTHCLVEIVNGLAGEIEARDGLPTVFYGHSIGGLLAFELAHALRTTGLEEPDHLIVTGRRAPHLPPPQVILHRLPDDAFINALARYDGTPEAVISDPELMRFFLPRLRADFAISENYSYLPRGLLACPITAFAGDSDMEADLESVFQWRYQSSASFRFRRMRGGHFFINSERQAVVDAIGQALDSLIDEKGVVAS
jgi:medium-chain acyl-[acyl-carrier-protein] hydrolase